uniref:peptidylprolyl isomerase n=1 Tax=Alexandrium monilatum TaxID=311494 RepID=A0A7S4VFY3_9DINO|mmetsp:Transcript_85107/g.266238  ORF Transcript_85107/g.266238 Transcript_85107/m.266238 type:complete len:388 (+) Transcript_85107:74-1237(+)
MAGSWRVVVQAVRDLDRPAYRAGDFARTIIHEDVKIKNAVVEVGLWGRGSVPPAQVTKPFNVDERGCAKVDQVLFVPRPSTSQSVLIRVVKPHRVQKDALIGEVEVHQASGKQRLQLTRHGKPRGYVTVSISDGIPVPPPVAGAPLVLPVNPKGYGTSAPSRAPGPGLPEPERAQGGIKQAMGGAGPPLGSTSAPSGGGLGECLQGLMACVEGIIPKSTQANMQGRFASACRAAREVQVLRPILAALGFEEDPTEFLERMMAEPGVQRLPSGLLYRVKRNGTGRARPLFDTPCDCHYRGRLANGKEFDSTYRDGKPARFLPRDVIKGWSEALQLMVEGDMWELFIPPELAYGERGIDNVIPGGAVLVFEMELVRVHTAPSGQRLRSG